jgi:hypothetical protein
MNDIALNEKYDEVVKEHLLLREHVHQLESELESTKEALRKKTEQASLMNTERSLMVTDAESGDAWSRMGGSNMLCYAPVAAMSYWRRWMGRPDDVHTS